MVYETGFHARSNVLRWFLPLLFNLDQHINRNGMVGCFTHHQPAQLHLNVPRSLEQQEWKKPIDSTTECCSLFSRVWDFIVIAWPQKQRNKLPSLQEPINACSLFALSLGVIKRGQTLLPHLNLYPPAILLGRIRMSFYVALAKSLLVVFFAGQFFMPSNCWTWLSLSSHKTWSQSNDISFSFPFFNTFTPY